jgi:hypothetical protein
MEVEVVEVDSVLDLVSKVGARVTVDAALMLLNCRKIANMATVCRKM